MSKKHKKKLKEQDFWEEYRKWEDSKGKRICDVCGIEVIFNVDIYEITGMCGACSTGEARLNYEEY